MSETSDLPIAPERPRRWQFSLKGLMLFAVCCAVTASVAASLAPCWPPGWPGWLHAFFVAWTGAIVGLILVPIFIGARVVDRSSLDEGRFYRPLVWGGAPVGLWIALVGICLRTHFSMHNERELLATVFGVTSLHLVAVIPIVAVHLARDPKGTRDVPLLMLRVLTIAGVTLPALATLICFVVQPDL